MHTCNMNEKVLVGPKFGTLIHRKWITNIWVVTLWHTNLTEVSRN
jgi:hypothetical protein